MSDSLDEKEEAYQRQQADQQTRDRLQLHKAEVLKSDARPLLDNLTATAKQRVERYNANVLPERRSTFTVDGAGGFRLSGPTPTPSMECTLDLPRRVIRAKYSFTTGRHEIHITLAVGEHDNITMSDGRRLLVNLDDAAEFLVDRVLYPTLKS